MFEFMSDYCGAFMALIGIGFLITYIANTVIRNKIKIEEHKAYKKLTKKLGKSFNEIMEIYKNVMNQFEQ